MLNVGCELHFSGIINACWQDSSWILMSTIHIIWPLILLSVNYIRHFLSLDTEVIIGLCTSLECVISCIWFLNSCPMMYPSVEVWLVLSSVNFLRIYLQHNSKFVEFRRTFSLWTFLMTSSSQIMCNLLRPSCYLLELAWWFSNSNFHLDFFKLPTVVVNFIYSLKIYVFTCLVGFETNSFFLM